MFIVPSSHVTAFSNPNKFQPFSLLSRFTEQDSSKAAKTYCARAQPFASYLRECP